jgi:hypothetical protein
MSRELEPWGGEVHLPRWMRRALRRPAEPSDTPERAHEARAHPPQPPSVLENVDRAAAGPLTQLYNEGRTGRR